jgi:tRNA A-37 threonylcarbamoyl transferase component Bud32
MQGRDAQQLLAKYGVNASQVALADGSILSELLVVRHVPDKRVVCSGTWDSKAIYVKIFIGQGAEAYAKRDADGIAVLEYATISTPKLLRKSECVLADGSSAHVIILEEIKHAKTADELWHTLKPSERFELASNLVKVIAIHHLAEVVHTDLHLKNFLVAKDLIYTLDGDGVRQYVNLTYQRALKNLAELISKFDVLEQAMWLPQLLENYRKLCEWHLPMDVAQVALLANRYRLKTASAYADKKVFRQCTDITVSHSNARFWAKSNAYDLPQLSAETDLDALLERGRRLKTGNTCTIALIELNNIKIVIKRYNIKGWIHALSRAFRPSRAAVSWANGHRLKLLNIATANPVALLETMKFGCLRSKAYYLSEYVDAPDMAEFFKQIQNATKRSEGVKNICTLLYKLYLLKISHGDMKATNIKILDGQPVLIDLDAMRQHKSASATNAAHVRDLKRLMQNWQNEPALYNAFVKTFKVVYPDISMLEQAGILSNKELVTR